MDKIYIANLWCIVGFVRILYRSLNSINKLTFNDF